jgi:hypothetical protein
LKADHFDILIVLGESAGFSSIGSSSSLGLAGFSSIYPFASFGIVSSSSLGSGFSFCMTSSLISG